MRVVVVLLMCRINGAHSQLAEPQNNVGRTVTQKRFPPPHLSILRKKEQGDAGREWNKPTEHYFLKSCICQYGDDFLS